MQVYLLAAVVWFAAGVACWAQEALPSFEQSQSQPDESAKEATARGPQVIDAERELAEARREYKKLLKKLKSGSASKTEAERTKYAIEMAEIRLRQAMLSESKEPEQHKIVMRRDLQTALARTKVKFANSEYETVKRLYDRGSKTKQELKQAIHTVKISRLELKRATINASDLPDAEKLDQMNDLLVDSAQLEYDLSLSNYETVKRLYQKSIVSKQRALYHQYLVRVAKIDLVAAKLEASSLSQVEKRYKKSDLVYARAKAKHKLLKTVHETNAVLYKKRRINKQEYFKSLESLNKSEIELDAAKEASISDVET